VLCEYIVPLTRGTRSPRSSSEEEEAKSRAHPAATIHDIVTEADLAALGFVTAVPQMLRYVCACASDRLNADHASITSG
jgi:hypothetical protein